MPIDPNLLIVKPVSELDTVANPTTGEILYYDGGANLKKTPVANFLPAQTEFVLGSLFQYTQNGVGALSLLFNRLSNTDRSYNKIKGYFTGAGNMIVHVYKDKIPDPNPSIPNFIFTKVSTHTIAIPGIGLQEIGITDIPVKAGEFLVIDKTSTSQPYYDGNTTESSFQVQNAGGTQCFGPLVNGLGMSIIFKDVRENVLLRPETVTITATRNSADYNSIRQLMSSITDASDLKKYVINIPAGTWRECDLRGKKHIKLKGAGVKKTIIINDAAGGMASLLTPADYSFPQYSNTALSSVPIDFRHVINATDDIDIEDMTISAISCKYPAHIDNPGYKNVYAKNVKFKDENCNSPVGVGGFGGQKIFFESCFIEKVNVGQPHGIFVHNWNNQQSKFIMTLNRCKFIKCNYALIDELGSDQDDELNLIDCVTDVGPGHLQFFVDKGSDGKTYWVNSATGIKEPNPANVPYCWILNTTGTQISTLGSDDSSVFGPSFTGKQRDVEEIKKTSIISLYYLDKPNSKVLGYISQNGTSNPTFTIVKSDISISDLIFTRISAGVYSLSINGFTNINLDKVFFPTGVGYIIIGPGDFKENYLIFDKSASNSSALVFKNYNNSVNAVGTGSETFDGMDRTPFKIEIYN